METGDLVKPVSKLAENAPHLFVNLMIVLIFVGSMHLDRQSGMALAEKEAMAQVAMAEREAQTELALADRKDASEDMRNIQLRDMLDTVVAALIQSRDACSDQAQEFRILSRSHDSLRRSVESLPALLSQAGTEGFPQGG